MVIVDEGDAGSPCDGGLPFFIVSYKYKNSLMTLLASKTPSNADIAKFREIFLQNVSTIPKPFELMLSGGVDSTTVLFACLELGYKPRCLSFHLDGHFSQDFNSAQKLAKHFDLDLIPVVVPSDIASTYADIQRVLPLVEHMKRTIVQCMIPWIYICPAMKTDHAVVGLSADAHYCNSRRYMKEYAEHGEQHMLQHRYADFDDNQYSEYHIRKMTHHHGKLFHDPYYGPEIADWFRQFKLLSLNSPYEKHISIRAFKNYYDQGPFRRPRQSYQVVSGIRDLHGGALMKSRIYNPEGFTDPVALYRRMTGNSANPSAERQTDSTRPGL
jgi:asparagine synthetase B (glutamine-hydrolysing)